MALAPGEARKDLSADALFQVLHRHFASFPDSRSGEVEIPLADALMSAFAMFSLKDPSLLAFDHRRGNPTDNFRTIYGINYVPCDSQMRAILDPSRKPGCSHASHRIRARDLPLAPPTRHGASKRFLLLADDALPAAVPGRHPTYYRSLCLRVSRSELLLGGWSKHHRITATTVTLELRNHQLARGAGLGC